MTMLKLYPADHPGHPVKRAEAGWPIGHGQPGIVAGNQATGQQQQESQNGNEESKVVVRGVVPGSGQRGSFKLFILTSEKTSSC